MPFLHKFQEHNFGNGFQTHNSILDTVPYEPEVIFVGTFNHGWSWNRADFFYGRGMYMWTALANLFLHNSNQLIARRTLPNGNPTLTEVFDICKKASIVFADIVQGIRRNIPAVEQLPDESVLVNNQYVWRSYKDQPLCEMAALSWLDDNVEAIARFINETKSIKHVYFTFKSGNWLIGKSNQLRNQLRRDVVCSSIFTPTAGGFRSNLPQPFQKRVWSLTHCWVWNGLNHAVPVNKPDYGHLDHNWLSDKGVNVNNF